MAKGKAGDVSVRFSVENAEAVRQALAALGKDGERTLKQIDAAAAGPTRRTQLLGNAFAGVRNEASALAGSLGAVGLALASLGPVGLVVAAAAALGVAAWRHMADEAKRLGDQASKVQHLSDQMNLSARHIQALDVAGVGVGVRFEQVQNTLVRMLRSLSDVRDGTGEVFRAVRQVSPELALQLAATRDNERAVDLLARAWRRMDDAQRAVLERALFGQRDVSGARVLAQISGAGGLEPLAKGLERSIVLTGEQTKKYEALRTQIDAIERRTKDMYANVFTEDVLERQLRSAQYWERIAIAVTAARERFPLVSPTGDVTYIPPTLGFSVGKPSEGRPIDDARRRLAQRMTAGEQGDLGSVWQPAPKEKLSPVARFNIERDRLALLGAAITPTEQLMLETLRLNAAVTVGHTTQEVANRALGAFTMAQQQASVATRLHLGILSESQLIEQRLAVLQDIRAKGFIRSAEEMAAAERLMRREVKDTMDALRVRASEAPNLTRLAIDADSLRHNLDQGLASALRGVTSDLIEVAKGTKTAAAGFSDFSLRIAEAIANAVLMKTVVGPLANSLAGGFSSLGGGASPGGGIISMLLSAVTGGIGGGAGGFAGVGAGISGTIPFPFARGGVVDRPHLFPFAHGTGLMGEAGPEAIMPLRRLPSGRLGVEAAAKPNVEIHFHDHVGVRIERKTRTAPEGGLAVDVMVTAIEDKLSDRLSRGKGSLGNNIQRRPLRG